MFLIDLVYTPTPSPSPRIARGKRTHTRGVKREKEKCKDVIMNTKEERRKEWRGLKRPSYLGRSEKT
jgi:hypothetical protein